MSIVEIHATRVGAARLFRLTIAGVYYGLFVTRDDARAAARRYDWRGAAAAAKEVWAGR